MRSTGKGKIGSGISLIGNDRLTDEQIRHLFIVESIPNILFDLMFMRRDMWAIPFSSYKSSACDISQSILLHKMVLIYDKP